MPRPKLWLIAGPNGAGKTTLVQAAPINQLLPHTRFLNPDDVTKTALKSLGFASLTAVPEDVLHRAFIESADVVFDDLKRGLKAGECLGVETVLSTGKYRELVELVRRRRGFVGLIYVALSSPGLSMEARSLSFMRRWRGFANQKDSVVTSPAAATPGRTWRILRPSR